MCCWIKNICSQHTKNVQTHHFERTKIHFYNSLSIQSKLLVKRTVNEPVVHTDIAQFIFCTSKPSNSSKIRKNQQRFNIENITHSILSNIP